MRCFREFIIRIVTVLLILAALLVAEINNAEAYELDTHFYLTYILSRHVGFNHDVAVHAALMAQWIDESKKTTPVSGLLIKGTAMRRHFHFHDLRQAAETSAHGPIGIQTITEASPNHPLGSRALFIGMTEGNFVKAFASIHMIQDTYGHAGYTAEMGHMEFGHNPDRPELGIEKYKIMIDRVIHALWAIRQLMPKEALDANITEERLAVHPQELVEEFLNDSGYMDVVLGNGLRDRHYVHFAISTLLKMMQDEGYIYPHVDIKKLVPNVEAFAAEDKFTHKAMTELFFPLVARQILGLREAFDYEDERSSVQFTPMEAQLMKTQPEVIVFNIDKLRKDVIPGQPIGWASIEEIAHNLAKDYAIVAGEGTAFDSNDLTPEEKRMLDVKNLSPQEQLEAGVKLMVFKAVTRISRSHVPRPFSTTHKTEFESEGPIRQFEKRLRTAYIQKWLNEKFGKEIEFDPVEKHNWFKKAISMAKDSFLAIIGKGKSAEDKAGEKPGDTVEVVTLPPKLRKRFDKEVGGLVNYRTIFQDMFGNVDAVDELTLAYQFPELFKALVAQGKFKQLATSEEVARMSMGEYSCEIALSSRDSEARRLARLAAGLDL